ncbi:MAG: isoaspartyl peptidase/L-asparaginase [Candidatus Thermoplasmatota archaeon]|jgi:L-asparaginase/beta-aspartyl-peptidase (threonine type)|nr:isoaspartyl peptidase/L-asparaginase [Candidatus Thermoplasmatota archaeon]MCL5791171.1 isoaspartyl peptidase/L-asparaginase [Candidatus Thermoplasmatota archaeon]
MENIILCHGGVGSKARSAPDMNGIAEKSWNEDPLKSVVNAVVIMEDDPQFNAGTGSVMRIDGSIQMDAAVSVPGRFGSVIGIEAVKNPVMVARDVMEKTPHIMLSGSGAVEFARRCGYMEYDPSTVKSREAYRKMIGGIRDGLTENEKYIEFQKLIREGIIDEPHDTVGAVARINGKFAAAVSTGGASPMMRGRVGDVPIPGAGIYCGQDGAVVATGIGEEIAKRILCYRIYSRIGSMPLKSIIEKEIAFFGDNLAGVIAVTVNEAAYFSNGTMGTDMFAKRLP